MSNAMNCAIETAKWLAKKELQEDVSIYVEGKRYHVSDAGELVYDIDADPKTYLVYAGDFMSMSFEGPLYNILNFYNDFVPGYDETMQAELEAIFKKYGKYYELGHAWNLSLYNI